MSVLEGKIGRSLQTLDHPLDMAAEKTAALTMFDSRIASISSVRESAPLSRFVGCFRPVPIHFPQLS